MIKLLLKLVLTAAAFWLAFRHTPWAELRDAFSRQQPVYFTIAFIVINIQAIFAGFRWHFIRCALEETQDSIWRTTLIFYASSFFNACLPSTIGGDVSRIWLAKKSDGHMKPILYGVIIDRIISLMGLLLLVASAFPLLFPYLGLDRAWGIAAAVSSWLAVLMGYNMMRQLLGWCDQLLPFRFIQEVIDALRSILGKHRSLIHSLAACIMAHTLYAMAGYTLAQGLGINIGWVECIALLPLVFLVSALPISMGGWGVREVGMITILALVGINHASALALSVQLGMITTLINLIGGIIYLPLKKR